MRLRVKGKMVYLGALCALFVSSSSLYFWKKLDEQQPQQPVLFSHRQHAEQNLPCFFCHKYSGQSREAGIPSVRFCMTCHSSVRVDSPEVQKVAQYFKRKEEVPWVRVYGFPDHSHVYFTHERHIAAKIECETCHGNVAEASRMERMVDHSMGWCVECHRENQAAFSSPDLALDCLTCHY